VAQRLRPIGRGRAATGESPRSGSPGPEPFALWRALVCCVLKLFDRCFVSESLGLHLWGSSRGCDSPAPLGRVSHGRVFCSRPILMACWGAEGAVARPQLPAPGSRSQEPEPGTGSPEPGPRSASRVIARRRGPDAGSTYQCFHLCSALRWHVGMKKTYPLPMPAVGLGDSARLAPPRPATAPGPAPAPGPVCCPQSTLPEDSQIASAPDRPGEPDAVAPPCPAPSLQDPKTPRPR
jgi:hypothetical protein